MKNFQMRRPLFIIATLLILSVVSFSFKKAPVASDKITICHIPPGNNNNCQQITVGIESLQAHLDHGDNLVCNSPDEEENLRHILIEHIIRDRNLNNHNAENIIIYTY
jgi:hypothetical protein